MAACDTEVPDATTRARQRHRHRRHRVRAAARVPVGCTAVPANLSPEYKAAKAALRAARDSRTRLEWLREMLRTIPKHKGTEHHVADGDFVELHT
jgi:hypothetical protein